MPGLAFANWPFGELELDISTKKKPGRWGRMDPAMAEAIADGARKGDPIFDIAVGDMKNPWVYKIDFLVWTQEKNVDTGTVRMLRFPTH